MSKKLTKTRSKPVGVAALSDQNFKGILKTQKGITLIALIITIIVMLILVGVSVSVALNGGLFETAKTARDNTLAERQNEEAIASGVYGGKTLEEWAGVNGGASGTPVDSETSYVGCFADLGNGEYGIIYADKVKGALSSSGFGEEYTIPTITSDESKTYYEIENGYTDPAEKGFGTRNLIVCENPDDNDLKDRFYVMALSDLGYFSWADAGMTKSDSTGLEFGDGIDNTVNPQKEGWFVPSKDEWAAFIGELTASGTEISSSTFSSLGLNGYYWSSSLKENYNTWQVDLYLDKFKGLHVINSQYIRLGTTF